MQKALEIEVEVVPTCPAVLSAGRYRLDPTLGDGDDVAHLVHLLNKLTARDPSPEKTAPTAPAPAWMERLQRRLRGSSAARSPYRIVVSSLLWSVLGSFTGIAILSALHFEWAVPHFDEMSMVIGSFGAQAVLMFAAPHSPLTQPWNAIIGSTVSSFAGVATAQLLDSAAKWLQCALAVSSAIALMCLTNSIHPPGGATALIAVTAGPRVTGAGFWYMLAPSISGSVLFVVLSAAINSLSADNQRNYPQCWWPFDFARTLPRHIFTF